MSDEPRARQRAEDIAVRLEAALGEERMDCRDAARLVGMHPNALRYAAPTGRFLIHWDGARQPLIWRVPQPTLDPGEARRELARRYLRVLGPGTAGSFASWAGVRPRDAAATFESLGGELVAVSTPIGDAWILAADEPAFIKPVVAPSTRLLPSGDVYYLLQGRDRELLVPDNAQRTLLWTPRVWPGAVLIEGEIAGTWRRSEHVVRVSAWRRLRKAEQEAVEGEAAALPLPRIARPISVSWE
jgi:hypothetical protein